MKYRLKVDKRYIFAYLAEVSAVFIILSLTDYFTITQAFIFTIQVGIIITIPIFGLYYGTFLTVDKESLSVFYFGFIKKSVPIEYIEVASHNYDGRGTLALSNDKLLIKAYGKEVPISVRDRFGFLNNIDMYKNKV